MNPAIVYIIIPILLAAVTNAIIFKLDWDKKSQGQRSPMLPPGWAIGLIWTFILGLLGFALYLTVQAQDITSSALIVLLILSCIAYPFYTSGLVSGPTSLVGNTSTLIGGFVVALVIALKSPSVLPYMLPILVWASYVNISDALYAKNM
jgi:translocator protein